MQGAGVVQDLGFSLLVVEQVDGDLALAALERHFNGFTDPLFLGTGNAEAILGNDQCK